MRKPKYSGDGFVSADGRLTLPREILAGLHELTGRRVRVTVEDAAATRTENQNAYYWAAIVTPITDRFNELGERFTTEIVHEILKHKFLRVFVHDPETAEVRFDYVRSTSSLKTFEFFFYCEDCAQYAAEALELVIEPPTVKRAEYVFPIFQAQAQDREKYLAKITGYLNDIFEQQHVTRFFRQNPDWENDDGVKRLFRKRYDEIAQLRSPGV
jgi:hypothetical protein